MVSKAKQIGTGGARSKLKSVRPVSGQRKLDAIDPGVVDQQGQAVGFKAPNLMGTPKRDFEDLGNHRNYAAAARGDLGVGKCDRVVMPCGTQGKH